MRLLLVIVLVALAEVALTADAAHARSYTVKTGAYQVTNLGPLNAKSTRAYTPTIREAIEAFGRPSNSFKVTAGEGCAVKWKRLGLRIEFYNFGVASSQASDCEPDIGRAQSFTIERSKKWRTWKGLRIGMLEDRVWDLHPFAGWVEDHDYYPDSYWLRSAYSPFGEGAEYPVLAARLRHGGHGRVSSFYGWIGAAGE